MNEDLAHYLQYAANSDDPEENCWTFVQYVLFKEFNLDIPEFPVTDLNRYLVMLDIREKSLSEDWKEVLIPREGDLILFLTNVNRPHIGIMVDENRVMHYRSKIVGPVVQPLQHLRYRYKIDGIYRNKQLTS